MHVVFIPANESVKQMVEELLRRQAESIEEEVETIIANLVGAIAEAINEFAGNNDATGQAAAASACAHPSPSISQSSSSTGGTIRSPINNNEDVIFVGASIDTIETIDLCDSDEESSSKNGPECESSFEENLK